MPELLNIVIVGGSLAGLRAAGALRRGGYAGTITFVSAENHLPYDRPPLSKQLLLGKWGPERITLATDDDYQGLALDLRLGRRATALDATARTISLDDGTTVGYDACIIATGATPRMLPDTPALAGIHTLRTLEDSLAIRTAMEGGARIAVVGGGFIGAEVAAVARQRGLEVTIIEALSQPLERALGARVGEVCAGVHRHHGATLRLGVGVDGFLGSERVEAVVLADGTRVAADCVVVGIGVRPETAWLESSGITLKDGVVCDPYLRTSAPDVYAAGDVCRWFNPLFDEEMRVEHWTNAVEQGMTAARNILGPEAKVKAYAPVPYVWSDQYDLSIQYVGHAHGDDEFTVKHGSLESGEFVGLYSRGGRLKGAVGFNMHRLLGDYRRLIGAGASLAEALEHVPEDDD